ncbi:MAG TPA: hypothetical protein PLO39_10085 [Saprospiraceae bacterium]|nr:hypothetical protein [Saprospiraceae bacterium]
MNKIHFLSLLISISSHSLFAQVIESAEIVVPKKIERFIDGYIQAWSRGDVKNIMDNVYDVPFSIIDGDSTTVFNVSANLENFLVETFKSLKNQGYGYSKRNKWERFEDHSDSKIIISSNYSRYLTTGEIMGVKERRATYIIQKNGKGYRITQLIPNK